MTHKNCIELGDIQNSIKQKDIERTSIPTKCDLPGIIIDAGNLFFIALGSYQCRAGWSTSSEPDSNSKF